MNVFHNHVIHLNRIENTKDVLVTYTKEKLSILGKCKLCLEFRKQKFQVDFYVEQTNSNKTIIGFSTAIATGILQLNKEIDNINVNQQDENNLDGSDKSNSEPCVVDNQEINSEVPNQSELVPVEIQSENNKTSELTQGEESASNKSLEDKLAVSSVNNLESSLEISKENNKDNKIKTTKSGRKSKRPKRLKDFVSS
ncbi:hypothetical protein TcasGA2_TC002623 [Tribolium castaneum]|uniref:Uncharacterized protein n=1 Tax=Tribolium castaneum TaxID=7070 RepID=D6WF53_TRICA|nr:hypothetical protein TcasGA2_TC002623 [Tribolium castaneum]